MRQHFNAKFDTAYYKLRQVLESATRLITNCHGTCAWSTLKFGNTFQTISNSSYWPFNELDQVYTKTDMYIYFFRIPHNTPSLFVLKFCISSCFQKLFRKCSILPIVYAEGGQTASVLWGTQIIASYVSILSYFHRPKLRKSSSSKAEPAITCN